MKKYDWGLACIKTAYCILAVGGTALAFSEGVEWGVTMLIISLVLTGLYLSCEK